MPWCYAFRRFCKCVISRESRTIGLGGYLKPTRFHTNKQNNKKYSWLSLVPLVLFHQFKFFYNFFFLMIGLSQFIPALKVGKYIILCALFLFLIFKSIGFMFTYIAPLVFVLTITIFKEGFDDF